jgi:methyltransferase (TIGR00027 family)
MTSNRRIDSKESRTAEFTCFGRACAAQEADERFRGPDYLAEVLIPPIPKLIIKLAPVRQVFIRKFFAPGIYPYVMARTKVMDAVFAAALEERFDQIVLLGAGFDTRALRFADRNHGTRVFELDIATTQQPKIEVLRRKRLHIPAELCFAPIDFDKEDIHEALRKAGYVDGQKCLFVWEGVTMYLSTQAVDGTLAFIRSAASSGSRVAFDYIDASVLRRENRFYGEREAFEMVAKVGEGWKFGLEEGAIDTFLNERGFELIAHYTPAELEKAFMTTADGSLYERINGTHRIAVAQVR